MLGTEDCANALLMIQPSLVAFKMDGTDEPVLLDSASIQPDTVLLMDSFFHILIYVGENIAKWRKAGFLVRRIHHVVALERSFPNMLYCVIVCLLIASAGKQRVSLSLVGLSRSQRSICCRGDGEDVFEQHLLFDCLFCFIRLN